MLGLCFVWVAMLNGSKTVCQSGDRRIQNGCNGGVREGLVVTDNKAVTTK
jgi:hypothetical protein